MCGIIGYNGNRNAAEILIAGLKKLEYRGYDSAGIALGRENEIEIFKKQGKVAALEPLAADADPAKIGIGHTRWATHGAPLDKNAHPHQAGRVVLVHNGIIENDRELRQELAERGIFPISDTDTELIALLLNEAYQGDAISAIYAVTKRLCGSFALGILFTDQPHTLYALRKDNPLIIGAGEGENFIASDIPAILEYTRDFYLPEEGELAEITADTIRFYDCSGKAIEKEKMRADWDEQSARKGGFSHYMAKEIHEQPSVIRDTIARYYRNGVLFPELPQDFTVEGTLYIVACGSAYHAGILAKYMIEKYARIPVRAEIASEFRYADPVMTPKDLILIISQSGETADSMAVLRMAKAQGVPTLGIVNVIGSSLDREADQVLYTMAGPEISVATTKAYLCQSVMVYLLALRLAKGRFSAQSIAEKCADLERLPALLEAVLKQEERCRDLAKKYAEAEHLFFLGRGVDYAIACEGSLKLKEISYLHSEAYAAGEMKHGTIALIEENTPVIAMMTDRSRYPKTAANIREVHSRGAKVLCITHADADIEEFCSDLLILPHCSDFIAPFAGVVLAQLFAYHTAIARGCDVDQPRNLAKSVTVE